jgi:hypothetical protein
MVKFHDATDHKFRDECPDDDKRCFEHIDLVQLDVDHFGKEYEYMGYRHHHGAVYQQLHGIYVSYDHLFLYGDHHCVRGI